MKLKDLIICDSEFAELEIKGITCNSRKVEKDFAFICINGSTTDGHNYAQSAIENGAAIVICERDLGLKKQIIVNNTHAAFSQISAKWFGNPADDLTLIGVTGTNGKTSITYILKNILEAYGKKVGVIGTIQNMIGDCVIPTENTTPDAYTLHSLFARMRDEGCSYAIMEISSHALDQCRVYDLNFKVAMFTNLTQDHLDYHITMDNYLEAKKKLFRMCETAIINSDDEYYDKLIEGLECKIITYSIGNLATYNAKAIKYKPSSVEYELMNSTLIHHIRMNTAGKFTVYNSLCAIACAMELGFDITRISNAVAELKGIKGRAEVVPTNNDFTIIIDYAHTPDGLKNILTSFKDCEHNRIVVLFGCGGDRDKTKRPIMGSIAAHYADFVIVTSDNPRTENPGDIINDILVGLNGTRTPFKVIENRIDAIKYAVETAQKDDIIVLAGKGHETYQILNTGKIHLDEREVVAEALAEKE